MINLPSLRSRLNPFKSANVPLIQRSTAGLKNPNPLKAWLLAQEEFGSSNTIPKGRDYANSVWVYACLNTWTQLAQVPLLLKREDDTGSVNVEIGEVYFLLKNPFPGQTTSDFLEIIILHLGLYGQSFILRNDGELTKNQLPQFLRIINPNQFVIKKEDVDSSGKVFQRTLLLGNQRERKIPVDGYIQIKLPNPYSDNDGLSPISAARMTIDADYSARLHNKSQMANRGRIEGVVTYEPQHVNNLGKLHDLKRLFNEFFTGAANAGSYVHSAGIKDIKQLSQTMKDLDWLEGQKLSREEICAIFGVPPNMVGILDRATFCLPAEARVSTPHGPKHISDIVEGDSVWSFDGAKIKESKVLKSGLTGEKQIYSIRTKNRTLKATGNHPVLTRKSGNTDGPNSERSASTKWTPVDELKVGDWIVQPKVFPDVGSRVRPDLSECTPEFAQFCGAIIGDGVIDEAQVRVCIPTFDRVGPQYRQLAAELFTKQVKQSGGGVAVQEQVERSQVTVRESRHGFGFSSASECRKLIQYGFGGRAKTKRIPGWIFSLAADLRLSFLGGLVDTDGYIDKRGALTFGFCNKDLVEDVKDLLLSVGIVSSNVRHQRIKASALPNPGNHEEYDAYYITASSAVDVAAIPFLDESYRCRVTRNPDRKKDCGKDADKAGLDGLGFYKITDISKEAAQDVYDICVEGNHSFVADGVVVHNSNYDQAAKSLWTEQNMPLGNRIANKLQMEIVDPHQRPPATLCFDFQNAVPVLADNTTEKITQYTDLITKGRLTPEMSAQIVGLDIGEIEQIHSTVLIPVNLIPAEDVLMPPDLSPPPAAPPPDTEELALKIAERILLDQQSQRAADKDTAEAIEAKELEVSRAADRERLRTNIWRAHMAQRTPYERKMASQLKAFFFEQRKDVLKNADVWIGQNLKSLSNKGIFDTFPGQLFDKKKWNKSIKSRFKTLLDDIVRIAASQVLQELDQPLDMFNEGILTVVRQQQNILLEKVNESTFSRLTAVQSDLESAILSGTSQDELAEQMKSSLKHLFNVRESDRTRIARTEINRGFSGGRFEQMKQAGVTVHEWLTSRDSAVRETHAKQDTEKRVIGELFSNGLEYPLDPSGPPAETIHCRCVALAVVE